MHIVSLLTSSCLTQVSCVRYCRYCRYTQVSCGSPAYTAPEILLQQEYDGKLADVWSLGILAYVMLVGRFPFNGASRQELSRAILRGIFSSPPAMSREPESMYAPQGSNPPSAAWWRVIG